VLYYNQVKRETTKCEGRTNMFEVGKIYGEDAVKYEVVVRTKKTVTIVEVHHFGKFNEKRKNERKVKVTMWDNKEVLVFGDKTVLA
jgi:hypothetical protein